MGDEQPSESATSPASGSTSANPPTLGGASEVINSSVDRRDGSSNKEKIECSWGGGDWTWGKPLSSEEPWEQVLCRAQERVLAVKESLQSLEEEHCVGGIPVGSLVEVVGLAKTKQYNGRKGVVKSHDKGTGQPVRLVVELELSSSDDVEEDEAEGEKQKIIKVMPSNLEVHHVPVAASHVTDDDDDDEVEEEFTVRSPVEQACKALEPGSEFEGIISIPGMREHNPELGGTGSKYTLKVVCETLAEDGGKGLLVIHSAYGDEQFCNLKLRQAEDGSASLAYSDMETQCDGTYDGAKGRIVGKVSQLLHGEEGFYVASGEVSHTFELSRVPVKPSVLRRKLELQAARVDRVRALAACTSDGDALSTLVKTVVEGDFLSCLEDAKGMCEAACARMRGQAAILQDLRFESVKHRTAQLKSLADLGISRAKAHCMAGQIFAAVRTVILGYRSSVEDQLNQSRLMTAMTAQNRLESSYQRLDKAMSLASKRLPKSAIEALCRPSTGEEGECTICLMRFEPQERVLFLPCRHMFHDECGFMWLHSHSNCPVCRGEVPEEEEEEDQDGLHYQDY